MCGTPASVLGYNVVFLRKPTPVRETFNAWEISLQHVREEPIVQRTGLVDGVAAKAVAGSKNNLLAPRPERAR